MPNLCEMKTYKLGCTALACISITIDLKAYLICDNFFFFCRCGGDGQMKCDPKVCSPEPMLRKMIMAAATRRR